MTCLTCIDPTKTGACDGTGVQWITDYTGSDVRLCPAWPADQDEPAALLDAQYRLSSEHTPQPVRPPMEYIYHDAADLRWLGWALALASAALVIGLLWPWR